MIWNTHLALEGQHAFLGASQYHWLNYSDDKLRDRYSNWKATERGTRLHALAAEMIFLKIQAKGTKQTFNMYVNDAIGFDMTPEQVLYFSENCFGTADAISFKKDFLRIHDLKTGVTPAKMEQLEIYAALFCLEYDVKPSEIGMELRIYQNDEKMIFTPTSDDIFPIMEKIIHADKIITELKGELL